MSRWGGHCLTAVGVIASMKCPWKIEIVHPKHLSQPYLVLTSVLRVSQMLLGVRLVSAYAARVLCGARSLL